MLVVALALGSSLAWGVADFAAGLKSRRLPLLAVLWFSQLASLPVMAAVVAVRGEGAPAGDFALYAALASASGTIGIAAFYRGLAVGSMSVVAPISALAAVIPIGVGLAAGERPSTLQAAGAALALAGAVAASRERGSVEGGGPRAARGVGLALLAALGFGGFFVGIDAASDPDAYWAILAQRLTGITLIGAAVAVTRPDLRVGRADLVGLAAIGVLDLAANALFAVASKEGYISLVGVLGSLYPVVTIVLARSVLAERLAPTQWAGVAVALLGVALIGGG